MNKTEITYIPDFHHHKDIWDDENLDKIRLHNVEEIFNISDKYGIDPCDLLFLSNIIDNQSEIDYETKKIIEENFWDLI